MYRFIDVNEVQGSAALPSEALSINGVYIENKIAGYRTLYVEGRESLESEISEMQVGYSDGARYQEKRDVSRTLTIHYQMLCSDAEDFRDKFNVLCGLLDQGQAKLIFADETDKYYIGTKSSVEQPDPGRLNVTGAFSFYCADPYKYGVAEKTASNAEDSTQITVENEGTKAVPVSVKVTMKSDNGYLGMSLNDHYYQVGNPEEPDIEESEGTILLFNDVSGNIYTNWTLNNGVLPPVLQLQGKGCKEQGAVGYSDDTCYVSDYGDRAGNADGIYWRGPSKTKTVPQDSNGDYPINWTCSYEIGFTSLEPDSRPDNPKYNMNSCGLSAMVFSDASGEVILWIGLQQLLGNKMVFINDKPVSLTSPDRGKNIVKSIEIEKIGDAATIRFLMTDGTTSIQKVNISKSTSELRKITWFAGMYLHQDVMEENSFKSMMFKKHNVEKIEDIPNYFSDGDVVYLDGENNKLYINDYLNWDVTDIGSQPLLLPPGQHTLGVLTSSFAEVPDIEVTFKERWI